VTGRALADIVRTATLGSYGVAGFAGGWTARLVERVGLGQPGLAVRTDDGIEIELDLTIALGVPVAEVARQVDSSIRYAIRRALELEVSLLVIHVDGLLVSPGGPIPEVRPSGLRPGDPGTAGPRELADSGTDVA
jgi:uncharacterized alkaline shock family protein YloU